MSPCKMIRAYLLYTGIDYIKFVQKFYKGSGKAYKENLSIRDSKLY